MGIKPTLKCSDFWHIVAFRKDNAGHVHNADGEEDLIDLDLVNYALERSGRHLRQHAEGQAIDEGNLQENAA